MRRSIYILLCLFLSFTALADSYVSVETAATMPLLLDDAELTQTRAGAGATLGLGYMYERSHFLLYIGADVAYSRANHSLTDFTYSTTLHDAFARPYTYNCYLTNRQDYARLFSIEVPALIGASFKHVYLLGGVKLVTNRWGEGLTKVTYRTEGVYTDDRYYLPFTGMDALGFYPDTKYQSQTPLHLGLDLRVCAEVGWQMTISQAHYSSSKRPQQRLQLGLFAEYGVSNIHTASKPNNLVAVEMTTPVTVQMNHAYTATELSDARVHSLTLGIRMRYMLRFYKSASTAKKCKCER